MSSPSQNLYVGGEQVYPSATLSVAKEFQSGAFPKNEEMVQSLKELETPLIIQSEERSGVEGRLAYGTQQLVKHTREMLEEKNSEDFLRNIHAHVLEAGEFLAKSASKDQVIKVQAAGQAIAEVQVNLLKQMVDSFRRMCIALAKNPSFRIKLIESLQLMQELATAYTQAALGKAEEKLEKAMGQETYESELIKVDEPSEGKKQQSKRKIRELMIELGKTKEYKDLVESVFAFFNTNWSFLSTVLSNEAERKTMTSLIVLASDVQGLVEKFSGNESLTPLTTTLAGLLYSIPNDQDFIDYFKELKCLLKQSIETPESINEEEINEHLRNLKEKATNLFKKEKLREDIGFVIKETKGLVERIQKDDSLKKVGEDMERLRKEVLLNPSGNMDLATLRNAVPALKNVLIPSLTSAFCNIPLPPLSVCNEKFDICLTNLNLCASDLIPEKIRIHFTNDIVFDFSPTAEDLFLSSLYVKMQEFNVALRDVNFKYDKKKMPMITDVGIADIDIIGTTIEMKWRMDMVGQRLCFFIDDVRCFMKEFRTNVKESRHMVINKIALTLFNGSYKRRIEENVEMMMREKMKEFYIDTSLPLSEQLPLSL